MGYAGGASANPSYYKLGNHTETVEIDYDPSRITYGDLLAIFWASHDPTRPPWSQQYKSIIFYHDDDQRQTAEASKQDEAIERKAEIHTEIRPFQKFWPAEDYHQKYYLRLNHDFIKEFNAIYPDPRGFTSSTAAARVNGFLGGKGTLAQLQEEIDGYGLSREAKGKLIGIVRVREGTPDCIISK